MSDIRKDVINIVRDAKAHLLFLKETGAEEIMRSMKTDLPSPAVSLDTDTGIQLEQLRAKMGDCRRCKLWEKRTNIVFGTGNSRATLLFVGEGPGQEEDRQGKPFVGMAGELLTKMIEAMGLKREDVYIANVIKCRPPGNRNPEYDEISACSPFLEEQIRIIAPRVICALGTFATQTLLETKSRISELRGRIHERKGYKIIPTFHPAYLLRNPHDKRLSWADLKLVMREMGSDA